MKANFKHILKAVIVGGVLLALAITCWVKPAQEYSTTERSPLDQFPKLTWDSVFNATEDNAFTKLFESYTLDQFPFRDQLRSLKAMSAFYLFRLEDNNNYYITDGVISKMDHTLNEESIEFACNRLQVLYDNKLKDKAANIYLSVIPDKNSFTAPESGHLSLDNEAFIAQVRDGMSYAQYIDILPLLSVEDYYATDTHWRQEMITDVANTLVTSMGATLPEEYEEHILDIPFYGVYHGQAAMPVKPDELKWLTNDTIDAMTAYHYQSDKTCSVYDMEKAYSNDPYEIFLSFGRTGPIVIENPKATTDKELVVFRDSFGSSIAPLLAQGYKTVTLIDLRETSVNAVDQVVDFTDKDVLFLYSTLVLNDMDSNAFR